MLLSCSRDFLSDENGNHLVEGDILKRPQLAATLTTVANEGVKAFYAGSLTNTIIEEITENGCSAFF